MAARVGAVLVALACTLIVGAASGLALVVVTFLIGIWEKLTNLG